MNSRGETGLVPESYLEVSVSESRVHRKMSTYGFTSVSASVSCGVSQGSVLVPNLFVVPLLSLNIIRSSFTDHSRMVLP